LSELHPLMRPHQDILTVNRTPHMSTMTSNSTKCPYCRQRYQQAAAYEKHLQKMHSDILSLQATVEQTLRVLTAFIRGENPNQTNISITNRPLGDLSDSYYEYYPSLEITDWKLI